MYLHCTMIYGQLGLTIDHSLWASWDQARLQGVAVIYGPARVQMSPQCMVQPECDCHHNIWSGLSVGVTIVYGWARVWVSSQYMVGPGYGCQHGIWSGLSMGVTIVYGQARMWVSLQYMVRPGCGCHHSIWPGPGRYLTLPVRYLSVIHTYLWNK